MYSHQWDKKGHQCYLTNADPREVCEVIRRQFGTCDFKYLGTPVSGTAFLDFKSFDSLDIVTIDYGCDVQITPESKECYYLFQLVLDGRGCVRYRDTELVLEAGDATIINQCSEVKINYNAQCRKLIIRIPREQLNADAISYGYRVPIEGVVFARKTKMIGVTGALEHIIGAILDGNLSFWPVALGDHYRRILNHMLINTFENNLEFFHALKPNKNPEVELIRCYVLARSEEKV